MTYSVSTISLEFLTSEGEGVIAKVRKGTDDEETLLEKVREFLRYWNQREWKDTEAIAIAGAKMYLYAPPEVWERVHAIVKAEFPSLLEHFAQYASRDSCDSC